MPDIKLAIMIIIHIHAMPSRRYHLTDIVPTQVLTQVNDLGSGGVDGRLELLDDGVVFTFEIAEFEGLDALFNDAVEVNHVVWVQLVILDVEGVESDVDAEGLILLDVVDDVGSVVGNTLWVAVRRLEKCEIVVLAESIVPVVY